METIKQALSSVLPSIGTESSTSTAARREITPGTGEGRDHETRKEVIGALKSTIEEKLPFREQLPQTISERVKPVETARAYPMEEPSYMDKIAAQVDYFFSEIKETQNGRIYARAIVKGHGHIVGDLKFGQDLNTGESCLLGSVYGLRPGEHAVNIHEFGDMSRGHASIGKHFNPFHSFKHGRPEEKEHHLGDLGNIKADINGHAEVDFRDLDLPLIGPFSIIGRAIEIHESADARQIPACDCSPECGCKGEGGAQCPRSHECSACIAIVRMGEPVAIGVIVHAPPLEYQQEIDVIAYVNPWLSLQGTTD